MSSTRPGLGLLILALSSALPLGAGAGTLSERDANRIGAVTLLGIAEPASVQVLAAGEGEALKKAAEGGVPTGVDAARSEMYSRMLAARALRLAPLAAEAITRALERDGYRASYVPDVGAAAVFDEDALPPVHAEADAFLAVRLLAVGYVAPTANGPFEPWLVLRARLLDRRSHELYDRTLSVGHELRHAVALPVNERYRYPDFDALTASLDDSAKGLKDAVLAAAQRLGEDFRVGSRPLPPAAPPSPVVAESPEDRDRAAAAALAAQGAVFRPPPPAPAIATPEPMPASIPVVESVQIPPSSIPPPASPALPAPAVPASIPVVEPVQVPPTAVAAAAPVAPAPGRAAQIRSRTPVRAQPTPQGELLAILPAGAAVTLGSGTIRNAAGDWCYVEQGTTSGWVPVTALAP